MKRIFLLSILLVTFGFLPVHAETFYYTLNVGSTKTLRVYARPWSNRYVSRFRWHFPGMSVAVIDGGTMFSDYCTVKAMSSTEYVAGGEVLVECYWYQKEYGSYVETLGGHFMFYITVNNDGSDTVDESSVVEVTGSSPGEGEANVATDVTPVLYFSQAVSANPNSTTSQRYRLETDDGEKTYLNAHFSNKIYPDGKSECEATFTPQQLLKPATHYTFILPAGSIKTNQGSLNSNAYQFGFTTAGEASTTPLSVISTEPADNAIGVETNIAPMVYFSDNIELVSAKAGYDSDYITLTDEEGRTIVTKYGVRIYENFVGLTPRVNLRKGTKYTFRIAPGQIRKKGTNIINEEEITVNFTTVDGDCDAPLTLVSTSPSDGEIGVALDVKPKMEFSSTVIPHDNIYEGLVLTKSDGTVVERGPLKLAGGLLWIEPIKPLDPGTTYTLYIPAKCLIDPATAALVDEDFKFSFTTKSEDGGGDYPIEQLTFSVSTPDVVDGVLVNGDDVNFNIEIDNPTATEFKGYFGVWCYFTENYVLGYTYWPSEDRNDVRVLPGNNQYFIPRTVESVLPCRFDFYFYPEKSGGILLGSQTITERSSSSVGKIIMQKKVPDVFNLSGQRVNLPQKGIYIINGKKVVNKR